jgi:chitinase
MARQRLRLLLVLVVVAVVAALALTPTTHAAGTLTATFTKDSDWGTGYQGNYTITNNTDTTIPTWTVAFTLPPGQTLGTFWDATLTTSPGNRVTATARSYNATLNPGTTTTFGYLVGYTQSGAPPTACTINGQPCQGGTPTSTAPPTSAPPTTSQATTTGPTSTAPPPTGGLPRHLLTGYWQDFVNGATPQRLSGVSSNYDIVAVAFAEADPTRPGRSPSPSTRGCPRHWAATPTPTSPPTSPPCTRAARR